ncbi:tyrosine-protein phosphatase [Mariniflexile sp. AS56]|uniref:tyrosine-protein phosphatase n=1 Tax=Mariniflexile sp. AS56 TaxID=3063957 RepID=UPI0026EA8D3A|nr:CpsB/CapC family capsule biosynthesis tyrosine phosphatase [Mariniflexile sp. AS56]MDO7171386.1 CpsB/CapC family capsule biosynthesis tyrosine phosphatase [Mariniflexile sp. AS56]
MLNFFFKKHYLKDLLVDFVDIHNHILPSIDDGAQNIRESIDLIKKLKELGVKQFIPTPHVMQDFYPNTDETIGNAYQSLLENLNKQIQKGITINPAAEYMLDSSFEKLLDAGNLFTLKGNYVLIEMSYFQPPINLEALIFKIKTKGYIPVLAHPERYAFYHNKLGNYDKLKQQGCLFQLNLLSLDNHYGKDVETTANYLIDKGLIDFTGTDAHHVAHVDKLSRLVLNKKTSEKMVPIIRNTNTTFSVI